MVRKIAKEKLVQARMWALFFGVLGIVPLEIIIPTISAIWDHKLFVFTVLSLYFIVYVLFLTGSLRVLWVCDRKALRSLKVTNLKIGRIGKMFVSAIEWAKMWTYRDNWNISWKVLYFLILIISRF